MQINSRTNSFRLVFFLFTNLYLEAKHSVTFQTPPIVSKQCNGNAIFIDDNIKNHCNTLKIAPKPPLRTSSSPSPSIDTPSPLPPHMDAHMMTTLDHRSSPNHRRHPLPPKLSQVVPQAAMDEMRV